MGVRGFYILLLAALPLGVSAETLQGHVTQVFDGDTFVLDGDDRVRLLDINTPEIAHPGQPAQAGGAEAGEFLRKMVLGKDVRLETGKKQRDVYGRLLAQVYLTDGTWVNGELVKAGMAHVYTFADNADLPAKLLPLEANARAGKRGIWAQPRWDVRAAATCCADGDIDLFMLVEGKPTGVVKARNRIYFNFGKDPRTDFSFFIAKKDLKYFKKAGVADPAAFYAGKALRVRGYLAPVDGVLIHVTHPAQIEIVEKR